MGIQRVTSRMMTERTLNALSDQVRRLMKLQDQLSTQRRITTPSDDPIGTQRAVNVRTILAKNKQYSASITNMEPLLDETDTAIMTANAALGRVRELTLQGANSTNAQSQLDAIANEINQLLETVFSTANHITDGRYIFAGTRSSQAAFTATRHANGEIASVAYQGNEEKIRIATGDQQTVVINENGQAVFRNGEDTFQTLIGIRDDLRAGNITNLQNTRLAALDTCRDHLLRAVARVGSVQNQLAAAQTEIEEFNLGYQKLLSNAIDVDYAEVVVNLNTQTSAYQAALNAASRILQPSLLDYI
ncbi:MAG TPA: flagellar hook-associated protein FlgL [Candidatus Hydrogenedentes bacterium]|nr:flagellar hook-associated protein FlgL [Candidatus Hydrogenedentota bacterium]HOS02961.1 flagellar hook-associated protein FlgL [Candidatus Hydrogenedentota bacterium]